MNFHLVRAFNAAGKLHSRLLGRIRMLGIISVLLIAFGIYQTLRYGHIVWVAALIILLAFLLGLFVFSKMNGVVWDEEKEIISTGRMDIAGFAILLVYIGAEVGFRTLLKAEYAGTLATTSYLLLGIGSSLLGRTIGTLVAIQKLIQKEGIEA
jgi:hypothetical protein